MSKFWDGVMPKKKQTETTPAILAEVAQMWGEGADTVEIGLVLDVDEHFAERCVNRMMDARTRLRAPAAAGRSEVPA